MLSVNSATEESRGEAEALPHSDILRYAQDDANRRLIYGKH